MDVLAVVWPALAALGVIVAMAALYLAVTTVRDRRARHDER